MYVLISSLPSSVYDKLYEGSMYYYAQAVIIKLSNLLILNNLLNSTSGLLNNFRLNAHFPNYVSILTFDTFLVKHQ